MGMSWNESTRKKRGLIMHYSVGQEVWMQGGMYGKQGKVVEVTVEYPPFTKSPRTAYICPRRLGDLNRYLLRSNSTATLSWYLICHPVVSLKMLASDDSAGASTRVTCLLSSTLSQPGATRVTLR